MTDRRLVEYICKHETVDKAMDYVDKAGLELSEQLAWHLIYSHCAAGQWKQGEKILQVLTYQNT